MPRYKFHVAVNCMIEMETDADDIDEARDYVVEEIERSLDFSDGEVKDVNTDVVEEDVVEEKEL